MVKVLHLKLEERVLRESEEILRQRKTSRNAYFNEAIDKKVVAEESALVSADSLEVLEAFERLSDELDQ